MKVAVIGSYREQEQYKYKFKPHQKDLFERTTQDIGRILARERCILLISWSDANPDSQFGERERLNHPYNETADFHALHGYLSTIKNNSSLIEEGAKVEIKVSRTSDRSPRPFGKEIDFYKKTEGVEVTEVIEAEGPKYRSELLLNQAQEADVLIVIGGGKATKYALEEAIKRKILLPLGFVGGIGNEAIEKLSADIRQRLITEVGNLENLETVPMIIAKLPTLIKLITSQNLPSDQSTQEEFLMPSPSPPPPSHPWSFLTTLSREKPWIFFSLAGLVIVLLFFLFMNSKVKLTPRGIEPNGSEPQKTENEKPDEIEVTVNYFCKWKSKSNLNNPVQSAPVVGLINGKIIPVIPSSTDTLGKVSFTMKTIDKVEIIVTHPDIKDSQILMTPVEIVESKYTLEKQKYVVKRDDCKLDKR